MRGFNRDKLRRHLSQKRLWLRLSSLPPSGSGEFYSWEPASRFGSRNPSRAARPHRLEQDHARGRFECRTIKIRRCAQPMPSFCSHFARVTSRKRKAKSSAGRSRRFAGAPCPFAQRREAAEARRRAAERLRKAQQAERARRARLDSVKGRGAQVCYDIERDIECKIARSCERATSLLAYLQALAEETGTADAFSKRVESIWQRHGIHLATARNQAAIS